MGGGEGSDGRIPRKTRSRMRPSASMYDAAQKNLQFPPGDKTRNLWSSRSRSSRYSTTRVTLKTEGYLYIRLRPFNLRLDIGIWDFRNKRQDCWGKLHHTSSQTGRSQVRFPMVSLEFFSDIILPVALWPWGSAQPLTEMSTRCISWG